VSAPRRILTSSPGTTSAGCAKSAGTGWNRTRPTDMPILNEAGAAAYPRDLIAGRLAREQIAMTSLLTGEAFG
jgi:hypothetical protein